MFTRNSDSENSKSSNNLDNTSLRAKPIEDAPKPAGSSRETVISNDLTIHGNVTSEGIVRLDDLDVGKVGRGLFGEALQEHRSQGEVRHPEPAEIRLGTRSTQPVHTRCI